MNQMYLQRMKKWKMIKISRLKLKLHWNNVEKNIEKIADYQKWYLKKDFENS